jgi:hypothetical protein
LDTVVQIFSGMSAEVAPGSPSPLKFGSFSKIVGCAQQHSSVAIMTAGRHFPRLARGMVKTIHFLDGQRVPIGAQPDSQRLLARVPVRVRVEPTSADNAMSQFDQL